MDDVYAMRCVNRLERDVCGMNTRHSGALNSGSMRTVPVNHSAVPLVELCEPTLVISI